MTNQNIIGKSQAEISEQTLLRVEYYDYLGNPIRATENVVLRLDTQTEYNITETESSHSFGTRIGGNVTAIWKVVDNALEVKAIESTATTRIVESAYYFELEKLKTEDKEYTRFKFIQ